MTGTAAEGPAERVYALIRRVRNDMEALELAVTQLAAEAPRAAAPEDEFLSIKELCARIPYAEQTIRNLISAGELRNGVHFTQRRRFGKVVFVWSAMERWLREQQLDRSIVEPFTPVHRARTRKIR